MFVRIPFFFFSEIIHEFEVLIKQQSERTRCVTSCKCLSSLNKFDVILTVHRR